MWVRGHPRVAECSQLWIVQRPEYMTQQLQPTSLCHLENLS